MNCRKCDREMADDEPVIWWWKQHVETTYIAGPQHRSDPVWTCFECTRSAPIRRMWTEVIHRVTGDDDYSISKFIEERFVRRSCDHCERPMLLPDWSNHDVIYCSKQCRWSAQNARRAVAPYVHTCEWCGEEFTSTRSDARTCSDKCRQRPRRKSTA